MRRTVKLASMIRTDQMDWLKQAAEADGVSMATMVRRSLDAARVQREREKSEQGDMFFPRLERVTVSPRFIEIPED